MLALWALSGARFSTICQVTGADINYVSVRGYGCVAATLWFDKIFDRQGRTIVLTCNCSPGIPADLQLCPTCPHFSKAELVNALTLDNWFSLQKSLGCPYHAMRRRVAIEIAKLNIARPVNLRVSMQTINVFMGWVVRSLMHREYTFDLEKHEDAAFPIAMPSLMRNLELTSYVESTDALTSSGIKAVRQNILKTTQHYRQRLLANDRLWEDFRIQLPAGVSLS
jgi:hypothetical protein